LSWLFLGMLIVLAGQPSDAGTWSDAQTGDQTRHQTRDQTRAGGAHPTGALGFHRYVAIGDSYTSGAGIPPAQMGGCFTSTSNYPHLLGHQLGTHVTDVSCAGATTANLLTGEPMDGDPNPPQLDGLSRRTDLVSVSLGINDAGFATLIDRCLEVAQVDSEGAPCRQSFASPTGDLLTDGLPEVRRRMTRALHLVQRRAPHAEVVLVGYPQLVPEHVTCPELPFASGDYAFAAEFFAAVDATLASAARRAGVRFVSLLEPSRGHDICAGAKAWVVGNTPDPRSMAWHPVLTEQRAAARLIRHALESKAHQGTH